MDLTAIIELDGHESAGRHLSNELLGYLKVFTRRIEHGEPLSETYSDAVPEELVRTVDDAGRQVSHVSVRGSLLGEESFDLLLIGRDFDAMPDRYGRGIEQLEVRHWYHGSIEAPRNGER